MTITYRTPDFGDFEEFEPEQFEPEEFGDLEEEGFGDGEEFGGEIFANGGRIDAESAAMLMDMYADMAAQSDSEEEADAFLPLLAGLAPLAAKLAPMALGAAKSMLPTVTKGVMSAGKALLSKLGPPALRALPNIARGVAKDGLQRAAGGQPVSGEMIMRSAAQHTLPYLQDAQRRQQAARNCHRRAVQAHRRWCPPGAGTTPQC